MYLSVGVVFAIMVVMASPLIWVAWWLLADLAQRANGSYRAGHFVTIADSSRRAA